MTAQYTEFWTSSEALVNPVLTRAGGHGHLANVLDIHAAFKARDMATVAAKWNTIMTDLAQNNPEAMISDIETIMLSQQLLKYGIPLSIGADKMLTVVS